MGICGGRRQHGGTGTGAGSAGRRSGRDAPHGPARDRHAVPRIGARPARPRGRPARLRGGRYAGSGTTARPRGLLVEIRYFPAELGGPDDPENTGFITPEAAEVRTAAIATLRRYRELALIDRLEIVPEFDSDSVVPNRLTMKATHSERPEAGFELTIDVW